MPVAQRVHLRRAARLAAGFHDVGDLVINFQETHRAAGPAAAAQFLAAGTDRRQIGAGAGTVFEQHRLAVGQVHDGFHVVLDRLDEARAALRIFVLGLGALGLAGLAVEKPVALAGIFADAVFVIQTDIEPHRRIERAVLVHAQPGQFLVKNFAVRLAEIAVRNAPVRNRPRNAMDELAHGRFALGGVLFAVKIFRHDDFRGEHRPRLRHLDIFLLENHLAGVVGDFGGALVPFDLVERFDFGVAEHALDAQRFFGFGFGGFHVSGRRIFCGAAAGGFAEPAPRHPRVHQSWYKSC